MAMLDVLVIGATGKQGGAVASLLRQRGHGVRALTRKPDQAPARKLVAAGATLVEASLDDRTSLEKAMRGVDAVFAMSTPFESGPDAEVKQGVAVADAASAARVPHLVYTSVGSADQKTGIPHFESKWKVEQHIRSVGVPATTLGPVYFMENVLTFGIGQLREGQYALPLPPERKLAQVAVADIAAVAVSALTDRDRWLGQRVDIASEDLAGTDCAKILSRAAARNIEYVQVPMQVIRGMSADLAAMYEWFDRVGYRVDIGKLRRDFPEAGWHTYESWAKEQDWNKLLG